MVTEGGACDIGRVAPTVDISVSPSRTIARRPARAMVSFSIALCEKCRLLKSASIWQFGRTTTAIGTARRGPLRQALDVRRTVSSETESCSRKIGDALRPVLLQSSMIASKRADLCILYLANSCNAQICLTRASQRQYKAAKRSFHPQSNGSGTRRIEFGQCQKAQFEAASAAKE